MIDFSDAARPSMLAEARTDFAAIQCTPLWNSIPSMSARHLLWINEVPRLVGGCERYILNTVHLLRERGLRASFLYEAGPEGETAEFLDAFDSAEPIHDLREQIGASDADLVYLHRFSGAVTEFANTNKPVARFFHDHHLFCLRKH